jgi:hypothetical protein
MDIDSSDQSDAEFAGKVKSKTFKQFQQENLIKTKVMPASKLAETAKRNAELLREFEAAAEDELRHRKTASATPNDKLEKLPLTRKRFEE